MSTIVLLVSMLFSGNASFDIIVDEIGHRTVNPIIVDEIGHYAGSDIIVDEIGH
ncbi:MAG: hypothetical protein O3C32_06325 [Bacteroidetes bacterium]|nr:hypothetical protein [Bacteroidota bacterium]